MKTSVKGGSGGPSSSGGMVIHTGPSSVATNGIPPPLQFPNGSGSGSHPLSPIGQHNQTQTLGAGGGSNGGIWDISGNGIGIGGGGGVGGSSGGGSSSGAPSLASLSRLNSMECWDYTIELECLRGPEDLQLAAELGKTLLERNKELETSLKHHQNIIEDQAQEIEYLTKQNGALREVNDSRMKIYEQLEVSIQDLERDKYKLALENQSEKKHTKTLCRNIESLEAKVEELNKTLEDVRRLLESERKKNERLQNDSGSGRGGRNHVQLKPALSDGEGNDSGPDEDEITEIDTSKPESFSFAFRDQSQSTDVTDGSHLGNSFSHLQQQHQLSDLNLAEENEELIRIMHELEKTRKCFIAEQNRVAELEEQLAAIAQENQILQSKIVQINTTEEMKSVHEELSILEEVRQGQMCTRCLRGFEDRPDDESIITGTEDDDRSLMDLIQNTDVPQVYRSTVTIKASSPKPDTLDLSGSGSNNPYRELVEKYEALLEVQRNSLSRNKVSGGGTPSGGTPHSQHTAAASQDGTNNGGGGVPVSGVAAHPGSLNEELGSGDFSSLNTKFTDEDGSKKDDQSSNGTRRKVGLRTPTDFSETETTSSGFSDEISNKATQTDERPRNFLCTIADGDDCKFSIYEDQTVVDSRFRFSPSHRELFREIFTILKKAADNRDEGEQLPLLDDQNPPAAKAAATAATTTSPKVPPVTPANEEPPSEFGDDTQSLISSAVSEQSFAMSECITKSERKKIEKQTKYAEKHGGEQENQPPVGATTTLPDGRVLTPYKRQPLEYLTVAIGVNKKKSRRRRNRGIGDDAMDRSDSPVALPTPTRVFTSSGRKGRSSYRPWNPDAHGSASPSTTTQNGTAEWNGNSMTIYNRSHNSPAPAAANQRTPVSSRNATAWESTPTSANRNGNRYTELTDDSGEVVLFKPSPASHDLHKLKKLDLSYAEVLRRADHCKHQSQRRHHKK
ncbi:keratin, type II cytoskeletal 2 epidermal isoform X2 [Toxorhynchites rutilus septentrionalis]|uniref:keratin, type II cytoskeletal 2 epidermal isoform X2 n=1 Tax=Toxorhynchites rutilus septentrionalis TaxID=329112 RepID=UPI0024796F54|nr:keratin, type II cytoskeletal 2 epidermal isoform X2 [Toxorhynchites rutilus septentrionalis]